MPASATTFSAENIHERKHIQQLLKANITALDESLMVIAEEFGDWIDSSRRIDLLCIDTDANLVVVELKRTEDGGHMELQAIRYAAMISEMTFEQLVQTHGRFRNPMQPDFAGARAAILEFLDWEDADEDQFGKDTRIILASANFSKELTTAVLWLREREIDLRCVRLQPYRLGETGPLLLDVQQIIPLPETAAFQTQIGVKKQAERKHRTERSDIRYRFWEGLLEYARSLTPIHANRKPTKDSWISGGIGRAGFSLSYAVRREDSQAELWISFGKGQAEKNAQAFNDLLLQREAIDAKFGDELEWMDLDGEGRRIRYVLDGGWKTPADQWPEVYERLVDAMIRLNEAVRGPVLALKI